MITTVGISQHAILTDILTLYTKGTFDLDVTYSKGAFYQHGVPAPRFKSDLMPASGVVGADVRALPFRSSRMASVVFDPPFIHAPGLESMMGQRFGGYRTQHDLRVLYHGALVEIYRVLRTNGILVMKCQDIVQSGKQVMNHCHVWEMATRLGFEVLDLFILVRDRVMVGHNQKEQVHARKTHSYFWVFKK